MPDSLALQSDDRSALRILVVDGRPDCADSLALLLRLWHYETEVAYNGPDACTIAQEKCPDVVIADIMLPRLDGFQLARRLCGQMVLIAVTGLGQEAFRQRAFTAGFQYYLLKPVDPEELHQVLDVVSCEKRR